MRIVSWNCGGALRSKFQSLAALNADICVVQECEDPARTNSVPFREWATNYLWVGDNKNRGLGVFARPGVAIEPAPLDPGQLQSFLPCLLKKSILLVDVWTRRSASYDYRYIGQLWQYIQRHKASLAQATSIVIGDLNSNVIWDSLHSVASHSKVVSALQELGLESTYHAVLGMPQGKEQNPTFYLQRKLSKPYHIDYAFVPRDWIGSCTIQVGKAPEWIELSDHMPVTVEIGNVT